MNRNSNTERRLQFPDINSTFPCNRFYCRPCSRGCSLNQSSMFASIYNEFHLKGTRTFSSRALVWLALSFLSLSPSRHSSLSRNLARYTLKDLLYQLIDSPATLSNFDISSRPREHVDRSGRERGQAGLHVWSLNSDDSWKLFVPLNDVWKRAIRWSINIRI